MKRPRASLLKPGEVLFHSVEENHPKPAPDSAPAPSGVPGPPIPAVPGMLESTGRGSRNSSRIFLPIFVSVAFLPSLRGGGSCHQSHRGLQQLRSPLGQGFVSCARDQMAPSPSGSIQGIPSWVGDPRSAGGCWQPPAEGSRRGLEEEPPRIPAGFSGA